MAARGNKVRLEFILNPTNSEKERLPCYMRGFFPVAFLRHMHAGRGCCVLILDGYVPLFSCHIVIVVMGSRGEDGHV